MSGYTDDELNYIYISTAETTAFTVGKGPKI